MAAPLRQAADLMLGFADRTGLTGTAPAKRYLWTDAFAVCNLLALDRATGESRYRELALQLVEQVHAVLGRHRPDAPVVGWLSGLDPAAGEARPTAGGLRIGKALPDRRVDEPYDDRLEWDRDGQYFHYLTRWMHALDQVARATGDAMFSRWARELAVVAHRAFVADGRMVWKLSVDLSRPVVASMGQHDPLDGFITCLQLAATAAALGDHGGPDLDAAAADFARMIPRERLLTDDPLGLGGLLVDASRLDQLGVEWDLREVVLATCGAGLRAYVRRSDRRRGAEHRLAFRELGLAIGLEAIERMARSPTAPHGVAALRPYTAVAEEIVQFWSAAGNRAHRSWREHQDISEVMLATSLIPEGYLAIAPAAGRRRPEVEVGSAG